MASVVKKKSLRDNHEHRATRSAVSWLTLLVVFLNSCWAVYHFQYQRLPTPREAEQAGKRGFSEVSAIKHVEFLTRLGPHPVGSDTLDHALQYVLDIAEEIRRNAHWDVHVQVDFFHAKPGANHLASGLFKGKTLLYSNLKHVILKVSPKYPAEAEENAILVSSHIDTVISSEGAGDCSSCIAVMLELARAISHWAHSFTNAVIFLFNTGEEEGLTGAHSFVTQHPWQRNIHLAIDLEAMGIGGKSILFQSGPDQWAIENFAKVAKYPSASIVAQDIFQSGLIKSATDFQIYNEVAGLSGLDFAYMEATEVYHTQNDQLRFLRPGSLQHLGENMLAFLCQIGSLSLPKERIAKDSNGEGSTYFDILGTYLVVYNQRLARMLYNSAILQMLLIWMTSLFVGGFPAFMSFALSCISIGLMWMVSMGVSIAVAFIVSYCSSPSPFITYPWLIVGLFGAPSLLGALLGQHCGYLMLQRYLSRATLRGSVVLTPAAQANIIQWEAERWLFKSGFVQWFLFLVIGNFYQVGSTYLALLWLVSPAFAYGLMEATLSPVRLPKQLKVLTLVVGLAVPVVVSGGSLIHLMRTISGMLVRFDGSPGSIPECLGNILVALLTSSIVCLKFVYLTAYVHTLGNKRSVFLAILAVFGFTLVAVMAGVFHPSTGDIARVVNVVHVVESAGENMDEQSPVSYISLFSHTPGKIGKEVGMLMDEGFDCTHQALDLVTFNVKYHCRSVKETEHGWKKSEIPSIVVQNGSESADTLQILIDTKISTRWALAMNMEAIKHFEFLGDFKRLIPVESGSSVHGKHVIQFSGGRDSPRKFVLKLFLWNISRRSCDTCFEQIDNPWLLRLRTDVNRLTPKTARVLKELHPWCSLFGKSTSPYTLAFLTSF